MKRIETLTKEQIIEALKYARPEVDCVGCPCECAEYCDGGLCGVGIADYLNEELETVPRICDYTSAEEAYSDYCYQTFDREKIVYSSNDMIDFAKFLMQEFPKMEKKGESK